MKWDEKVYGRNLFLPVEHNTWGTLSDFRTARKSHLFLVIFSGGIFFGDA